MFERQSDLYYNPAYRKLHRRITLCGFATIFLILDTFPLGAKGFLFKLTNVHSAILFFYGLVAISSFWVLSDRLPLSWAILFSANFTFLSLDYWELPFPWTMYPAEGTLYFIFRWRLFPVLCPLLIFFIFFTYKWTLWKHIALTLPGFLYLTVFPLMTKFYVDTGYIIHDCYISHIGWLSPGAFIYMPNRVISTVLLGWVLLNGRPSPFFKKVCGFS